MSSLVPASSLSSVAVDKAVEVRQEEEEGEEDVEEVTEMGKREDFVWMHEHYAKI